MATDEKQRILDWCSAESDVRCVGEDDTPGNDFSLVLESGGSELTAALPSGGDRVVLRNVVGLGQAVQPAGGGDLSADLAALEERRPGPVTVRLSSTGDEVVIANWVVLDGLTKHSFLTAVSDVSRTRSAVLRLTGLPADVAAAEAAPSPVVAEAAPEEMGPAALALSGVSTEAMPEMAVVSEPAATSEEAAPIAAGWVWPPASASPVEAVADQAAVMPAAQAPTAEMPEAEMPVAEMPVAEMPAVEEPVQEPTAEPVLAGAEEESAPSPWDAFPGTTAEPAPETAAPAGVEQVATPSPWAAPEATTFEPLTTPTPAPAQGYPQAAQPGEFAPSPSPVGPVGPFSSGGSAQDYVQPFTPAAAAAPVPAPAPAQPVFTPGHRVPPQGMQAWAAPDPAGAVIATLGGHLPVQVTEVRGAWAHVLCSNGWTGWVDDRLLIAGA
ncbi:MAG: hypothetical protein ABSH07_01080 [Candidatus Dormibacteria bacterium]|jgi:hypothetical protein